MDETNRRTRSAVLACTVLLGVLAGCSTAPDQPAAQDLSTAVSTGSAPLVIAAGQSRPRRTGVSAAATGFQQSPRSAATSAAPTVGSSDQGITEPSVMPTIPLPSQLPTISRLQASASNTTDSTTSSTQPPPSNPAQVGAPTNVVRVTARKDGSILDYRMGKVDFRDPGQVAWAFATSLFNYSYRDASPKASVGRAARFAVPKLAGEMTSAAEAASKVPSPQWKKLADNLIEMKATVTTIDGYLPNKVKPGAFAIMQVNYRSLLTQANQQTPISTKQLVSITVTVQPDGTWLVSSTGNSGAN